jgi:hypothetical protein
VEGEKEEGVCIKEDLEENVNEMEEEGGEAYG